MTPDILRKLRAELEDPITTERQVVYILCQVRKIVDRDPDRQRWKSLKLYCDWAMHPDLTYDRRTRPFLEVIDQFFFATLSPNGTGVDQHEHEAIQKLVYLDGFRDDLRAFLHEQQLPHEITDDDVRWNDFLRQYGSVIRDGSLTYDGNGLQFIKRMKFTTLQPSSEALPFTIKWEIETKDGQGLSFVLQPSWKLSGSLLLRHHATASTE